MNYNNLKLVNRICARIENNTDAVSKILEMLDKYPMGNSDGSGPSSDKKLYALYLCEYSDGSGLKINLTGSMIQTEILKFALEKLQNQINVDHETLETL